MKIFPAIDIMKGNCVRLYQGRKDRETIYSKNPVQVAREWEVRGAEYLHVVDLDGAFAGETSNKELILDIQRAVHIPVQLGGGIRNFQEAVAYLKEGIDRVILGTMALRDPEGVKKLSRLYPDGIVVGIDSRQDTIAVEGWMEEGEISPYELAKKMKELGVKRFIITDIKRDGTLSGPNMELLEKFKGLKVHLIAAGGIATLKDLKNLTRLGGIEGAIIGQALYTGDLTLEMIREYLKEGELHNG